MADTDLLFKIIAQDEAKQALAEARAEVDKMTEAERESVKAAHEAQASDKALAESKRQVIDATDKATESSNRWFKSLVDVKAGIDIARGIAEPIMNVANTAIQAASDLSETKNKIDTLFGSSSNAIQQWAQGAATSIGQSTKQALDGASTFGVFGKAAGLAGQDLAKFAQDNIKLASDMASFFNTSPDEAIQAIGAAFRGEQEPIRRYGVLIDEASLKNEAMKLGLISTTKDALQPQQRVLAAQALILQQTGAAQGDFAKTADGLANSQRIARAELENTMASIGERFLPIAQKGVGVVNGLLGAFNSLPKPMQDVTLAFGGIAIAAVPVISNYSEIKKVGEDVAKVWPKLTEGLTGFDKALKATEIGIIIAGLIAIAKYIDEVGVAAKATSEDLIKMSNSGDLFKQAAASTEIMINGQERLNKVVRDVGSELKEQGKSYEAYRAGVLGAAVAAGTLTQAQADELLATGKVTDEFYHQVDVTGKIIQATGLQSRAVYEATEGWGGLEKVYKVTTDAGKQFLSIVAPQAAALADAGAGADMAAARYQAMGEAMVKANDLSAQSIDVLKIAMGGVVSKEIDSFNAKQDTLKEKATELQRTISTSYGKARDDAIKSLADVNKELGANADEHDKATKRILFDIAAQQLATIQDPQIRARAMNELALQWDLVDKKTYDATTSIIGSVQKLSEDKNLDAFIAREKELADLTLHPKGIEAPVIPITAPLEAKASIKVSADTAPAKQDVDNLEKDVSAKKIEIKATLTVAEQVKATAGDSLDERRAQVQKSVSDTGSVAKKVSDDLGVAGKNALEALGNQANQQADKVKSTGGNILQSFKDTGVGIMALVTNAANTADKDMAALVNKITRAEGLHEVIFNVKVTGDAIPSASGGSVPGRQSGGPIYTEGLYHLHPDEYVLSAPMRYGQQAIPQQAIPSARGGNTNITTNNFYDAAAAKLWQEKQRLDRVQSVLEAM